MSKRNLSAHNTIITKKGRISMAIFGVREEGSNTDVTTIQVAKAKSAKVMRNRAMKAVEELQESGASSALCSFKNYEVVLLWIER